MQSELWLPTGAAAQALGVHPDTLKRRREISGGFLENRTHYIVGPTKNSPIIWRIESCREAFNARGMQVRKQLAEAQGP